MPSTSRSMSSRFLVFSALLWTATAALQPLYPRQVPTGPAAGIDPNTCRGSKFFEDNFPTSGEDSSSSGGQIQDWLGGAEDKSSNTEDEAPDTNQLPSLNDFTSLQTLLSEASKKYPNDEKYCTVPQTYTGAVEDCNWIKHSRIIFCHNGVSIRISNCRNKEHKEPDVRVRCDSVGIKIAKESADCYEPFNEAKHVFAGGRHNPSPKDPAEIKKAKEDYDGRQKDRRLFVGSMKGGRHGLEGNGHEGYKPGTFSMYSKDPTWGVSIGWEGGGKCPETVEAGSAGDQYVVVSEAEAGGALGVWR